MAGTWSFPSNSTLIIVLVWIALGVGGASVTAWCARRMWKRRTELPTWTKVIVAILVGSAVFGALGVIAGLIKAFGAVGGESIDPSQKARILAEGIAEAMNCTALGAAVWLASAVVLNVLSRLFRKRSN